MALRRTVRGLSVLAVANLVAKMGWFGFAVLYCGLALGPSGYGVFTTVLAISLLAAALFEGAFYPQAMRLLTNGAREDELGALVGLRVAIGSVATAVTMAGVGAIREVSFVYLMSLGAGGVYVTFLGVRSLLRAAMESHQWLEDEARFLLLERGSGIALAAAALYVWGPGPLSILAGFAAGQALTCLVQARFLARRGLVLRRIRPRWEWTRRMIRASAPLSAAGFMGTVYYRSDQVLVEHGLGTRTAGLYGLMYQVLLGLNLLPSIVSESLLFPRFARWHREGRRVILVRTVWQASATLGVVGVVGALCVGWFGEPVLERLGLDAYRAGLPILYVLAWAFPLNGIHAVLNVALLATQQDRSLLVILTLAAVLSVALVTYALGSHGAVGVAWATVAAEGFVTAGCLLAFLRVLRASPECLSRS